MNLIFPFLTLLDKLVLQMQYVNLSNQLIIIMSSSIKDNLHIYRTKLIYDLIFVFWKYNFTDRISYILFCFRHNVSVSFSFFFQFRKSFVRKWNKLSHWRYPFSLTLVRSMGLYSKLGRNYRAKICFNQVIIMYLRTCITIVSTCIFVNVFWLLFSNII